MAQHSNPKNAGGGLATRGQRFHPLDLFHREVDSLFNRFFGGGRLAPLAEDFGSARSWGFDVDENDNEIIVRTNLPGFEENELDVRLDNDVRTIAARAIENNNIGAVVVQGQGRVVGIVTDRDLAVRVLGQGRDPRTTSKNITRQVIEEELCERLSVDPPRAAQLLEAVGATIASIVSPGQIQDVQDQLPEEMPSIFTEPFAVGP